VRRFPQIPLPDPNGCRARWSERILPESAGNYEAKHGDYNTVLKYRSSKPNEYFLVENRSKMDLDRGAVGSGLAVYHCDILGSNELQQETAAKHYQCALLQADGHRDLEMNVNQGDGSDLFGEIHGIALSAESSPHSREWDGRDSGLVIADIGAPGPAISFSSGQSVSVGSASGEANPMMVIPDDNAAGIASTISIAQSGTVERIRVSVDIEHSFIGDLRVILTSPAGRRAILHTELGGSQDNLIATYDSASPGELASMVGQPMKGDWVLSVFDRAAQDEGTLRRWSIELKTASAGVAIPAAAGGGA
jgi:subtilisin-like proprotein convertase family protein